jgi:hypothetical protein
MRMIAATCSEIIGKGTVVLTYVILAEVTQK